MERWADIAGFEGSYQVSDQGRLRSLDREITNPASGGSYVITGQILNPRRDSDGYAITELWKNGRSTTIKAHRLVLLAFVGRPPSRFVADHIHGQRDDNRLENLRWVSVGANVRNRHKVLGASGVLGVRHRKGKPNPWQAYIHVNGRFRSVGHFSDKEQARAAREAALQEVCNG